jgi:hypothetical protein
MAVIVLGVAWFVVSALNTASQRTVEVRVGNAEVLAQAKAALIGWMVTNAAEAGERNPGRLPCPEDSAQDGTAAGSCDDSPYKMIGRLPWRTLGLPKLLDTSGEPLWYAVSPGWALPSTSATLSINSDSVGNLTVDGQSNAAVALVIAPGGPVNTTGTAACSARTQQRGASGLDRCEYLESLSNLGSASPLVYPAFVTNGTSGAFNDQVLAITAGDLIPPLEAAIATRAQRDLAPLLADAAKNDSTAPVNFAPVPGYYPFAATWTTSPTSVFAGTVGTSKGMLPLVRSRKACDPITDPACDATLKSKSCVPGTDLHCDATSAVNWNIGAGIQIAISGGTGVSKIGALDCSPSTPGNLSCTLKYGYAENCTLAKFWCGTVEPVVKVTARTTTAAGLTFRRVNEVLLSMQSGPAKLVAGSGKFQWLNGADAGALEVQTGWQLPKVDIWWFCDDKCGTATIQIPSLYIEDNIPFQSRLREPGNPDLRWFLADGWHQLAYFAVAPSQVPDGGGSCAGVDCLTVSGVAASLESQQALLILAGRALSGAPNPRTDPAHFLEGSNADGDLSFERKTVDKAFNDRIILINPLP